MSSRHQFHLRWSNYGHNLANSFVRLFESESLADVTLFCEGESYRAHRVVLAASSQHFQDLFEQCSSAQLVVILDGTSSANLRALLEFMYKGEVYIDDANLNSFLQTAKRLQVKGLSLSQNDLQSISNDASGEEKISGNSGQENMLAQALGPLLQQPQGAPPTSQSTATTPQKPPTTNSINVQSPPTSFSSPSPSQTPPNPPPPSSTGLYAEDKLRKKFRISASPKRTSPEGNIPDGMEYSGHHPPRPSAPVPSPSIPSRLMEMDQRSSMVGGFSAFGPMYPSTTQLAPPPSPQQGGPPAPPQQQTIVITENPNIRKIRSASTENTMPEDLSIKLEVGREEDLGGVTGKQRSFSMDLSPSEGPPFGGLTGPPGPSSVWSLPSPSAQHVSHDLNLENAQSTPDGKKLKCPFCERLYGYETNLRAHIRQRHQGIRVPCPFCTRTFTRNNTVRRHVAREHRALLGGVRPFHHPQLHGTPGEGQPPPPPFGSPPSATSSPSQGSSPSTSSAVNNGSTSGTGLLVSQMNSSQNQGSSLGGPLGAPPVASSPPLRPSSNNSSIGSKPVD